MAFKPWIRLGIVFFLLNLKNFLESDRAWSFKVVTGEMDILQ